MVNQDEYSIEGKHGRSINFDVRKSALPNTGVVVFCHGFKGFKDWGHFNLVAQEFASQGLAFVKLNFSHNGTSAENLTEFVDLEAFAQNNFSKELDDLGTLIDWVEEHLLESRLPLYLMGHSRGGGIAILKAVEDNRIKRLVTWSAVSDFESRFPEDMERFKQEGVVYIPNARTHQNMPLYYQFVEDYYANQSRLDIPNALSRLEVPYLIIHGSQDESVSTESAEFLYKNTKDSELRYIKGTGHTFGATHPFEEDHLPPAAQEAVILSIDFLK